MEKAITLPGFGKVVLAACQASETAKEDATLGHGIFTFHLLNSLMGEAADAQGKITASSIHDYIAERFESYPNQKPVFKGDFSGRLIIGEGLTPRITSALPLHQIEGLERQAQSLMIDYMRDHTQNDLTVWHQTAYRTACQRLETILDWFERKIKEHPQLQNVYQFKVAYDTAKNKLKDLGNLQETFNTPVGFVETHLGFGTFGTVWKIKSSNEVSLAYKVYHPTELSNTEKRQRFKRGFDAMKQLDHPNIVCVHSFTACPIGFTMDFIDGPNLRNFYIDDYKIYDKIIHLQIIAEALQHAHSRKVIHRDIKPENVIMETKTENAKPYITDFDLAWYDTATQFTKEGVGSLKYAAPEQLASPNSADAHAETTDIFSFGQLFFFLLTGRDPINQLADNSRALREALWNITTESSAQKIVQLYEGCTNLRPSKRIHNMQEVVGQLLDISHLLRDYEPTRTIGFRSFVKELSFQYTKSSADKVQSDTSFFSTTGKTLINVEAKNEGLNVADITFRIQAQEAPVIKNAPSYKEVRKDINYKLDQVLNSFHTLNPVRQNGSQGSFETLILIRKLLLNMANVSTCCKLLIQIIDCIEGG